MSYRKRDDPTQEWSWGWTWRTTQCHMLWWMYFLLPSSKTAQFWGSVILPGALSGLQALLPQWNDWTLKKKKKISCFLNPREMVFFLNTLGPSPMLIWVSESSLYLFLESVQLSLEIKWNVWVDLWMYVALLPLVKVQTLNFSVPPDVHPPSFA